MKKIIILLFLLISPTVFAGNINYTIVDEKSLVDISFTQNEYSSISFPIEKTILDYDNFSYISYITKSFIEKSKNKYFFIASNNFHRNSNIKITLPIGAIIDSKHFIFPKNYTMSTNGQNIVIYWYNPGEKEIFIPYTFPSKFNIWIILTSLIIFILIFYILIKNYKSKNKSYTKNLFYDEKKIMKYLTEKKECWTKEIVRDLNISKVKLSRKLRSLEEKGLITKTPHGNENRIQLVK